MAYRLTAEVRALPTPPAILARLLETLDDPDSSASRIEELLAGDQATTARLLAMANSAYYGLRHGVSTVARAVVVLGVSEVRAICLGAALASLFQSDQRGASPALDRLWGHSLAVSEIAQALAAAAGRCHPDLARTVGLLHDLGYLVLMELEPVRWRRLLDLAHLPLAEAEAEAEVDHQAAGRALAAHWDLPAAMGEVLGGHHGPHPAGRLCALVQVADFLATGLGYPPPGPTEPAPPGAEARNLLGLSPRALGEAGARARQNLLARQELWRGLGLSPAPPAARAEG